LSNNTTPSVGKIWRRLSRSQRNALVAAHDNEGILSKGLRLAAADHLEQEGLVMNGKLTNLGLRVVANKPS
jgi:hypothetical protein